MEHLRIITTEEFKNEILEEKVVVCFSTSFCGPCKVITPILETLGDENKDIKFSKIILDLNEDGGKDLIGQFGIKSVPTIIFFKDGKIVDKKIGVVSREVLLESLLKFG